MVTAWSHAADLLDPPADAYRARGACSAVQTAADDELLLSGPAGTGKSRACLERLHSDARRYPGMRALVLRKTATSLTTSAIVTYEEHVAVKAIAGGEVVWQAPTNRRPGRYLYDNGSMLVPGGLDKATKIMSTEYDMAYVQEAIELTVGDWEAVTTRLRNGVTPHQQLIADTNPSTPMHWLKKRCDDGECRMLESRHSDNPRLFAADGTPTPEGEVYIRRLDRLTGPRKARLRHGLWTSAEGAIYGEFDPAIHMVDRFAIPADWPRWWVVDFGYRNPFVCQWWAADHDGRLYRYREIYMTGRLVEDHARQMLALVSDDDGAWTEPQPQAILCDHDAEDRATLERHLHRGTRAADKRVTVGIEAVQSRLRTGPTGKAGLVFLRDSLVERDPELVEAFKPTCTEDEMPGYVWATSPEGKRLKDEPVKLDDHGADCTRYLVAHADLKGRGDIKWLD